jgi:hypothetical protein
VALPGTDVGVVEQQALDLIPAVGDDQIEVDAIGVMPVVTAESVLVHVAFVDAVVAAEKLNLMSSLCERGTEPVGDVIRTGHVRGVGEWACSTFIRKVVDVFNTDKRHRDISRERGLALDAEDPESLIP